jgi:hypothetical protein
MDPWVVYVFAIREVMEILMKVAVPKRNINVHQQLVEPELNAEKE